MIIKIITKNSPDAVEFGKYVKSLAERYGLKIANENADLVIVIGGDGTLLKAVKENLPIIGIRYGRRSALLDVKPENVKEMFERLLKDDYRVDEYPLLSAKSKTINTIAFNEVAVLFNNPETVYGSITIREKRIIFEGDGVLVSTPQGSWAWSFSATRVLLHKDINGYEITFMNPIVPNIKAIVVPLNEVARIRLEDKGRTQIVRVISDGEIVGNLVSNEDEELIITNSERKAKILRFYNMIELNGILS